MCHHKNVKCQDIFPLAWCDCRANNDFLRVIQACFFPSCQRGLNAAVEVLE